MNEEGPALLTRSPFCVCPWAGLIMTAAGAPTRAEGGGGWRGNSNLSGRYFPFQPVLRWRAEMQLGVLLLC